MRETTITFIIGYIKMHFKKYIIFFSNNNIYSSIFQNSVGQ